MTLQNERLDLAMANAMSFLLNLNDRILREFGGQNLIITTTVVSAILVPLLFRARSALLRRKTLRHLKKYPYAMACVKEDRTVPRNGTLITRVSTGFLLAPWRVVRVLLVVLLAMLRFTYRTAAWIGEGIAKIPKVFFQLIARPNRQQTPPPETRNTDRNPSKHRVAFVDPQRYYYDPKSSPSSSVSLRISPVRDNKLYDLSGERKAGNLRDATSSPQEVPASVRNALGEWENPHKNGPVNTSARRATKTVSVSLQNDKSSFSANRLAYSNPSLSLRGETGTMQQSPAKEIRGVISSAFTSPTTGLNTSTNIAISGRKRPTREGAAKLSPFLDGRPSKRLSNSSGSSLFGADHRKRMDSWLVFEREKRGHEDSPWVETNPTPRKKRRTHSYSVSANLFAKPRSSMIFDVASPIATHERKKSATNNGSVHTAESTSTSTSLGSAKTTDSSSGKPMFKFGDTNTPLPPGSDSETLAAPSFVFGSAADPRPGVSKDVASKPPQGPDSNVFRFGSSGSATTDAPASKVSFVSATNSAVLQNSSGKDSAAPFTLDKSAPPATSSGTFQFGSASQPQATNAASTTFAFGSSNSTPAPAIGSSGGAMDQPKFGAVPAPSFGSTPGASSAAPGFVASGGVGFSLGTAGRSSTASARRRASRQSRRR